MANEIMHVGLTVSDLDRSIAFYMDVLGLEFLGSLVMEGEETDALFGRENAKCRVAYLKGTDDIEAPALELICFEKARIEKEEMSLFRTGISEICFHTPHIDEDSEKFRRLGVPCISAPQEFDFTRDGFGRSKAIYLRDPDGIIVELMESLD